MNDTGDIDWKARSDKLVIETEEIEAKIEKLTKDIASKDMVLRDMAMAILAYNEGIPMETIAAEIGIDKNELLKILSTENKTSDDKMHE